MSLARSGFLRHSASKARLKLSGVLRNRRQSEGSSPNVSKPSPWDAEAPPTTNGCTSRLHGANKSSVFKARTAFKGGFATFKGTRARQAARAVHCVSPNHFSGHSREGGARSKAWTKIPGAVIEDKQITVRGLKSAHGIAPRN